MKKSRYTETQIIKVLKKVGGQPIRTQFGDAAIVAVHAQQSVLTLSAKLGLISKQKTAANE